jgi:putative restriction endonuclease
MQAYVGVTDFSWFDLLRKTPGVEEVNFWQPGGNQLFKSLKPGELFLFKLHYPINKIVGYGFFAHSTLLPISLAWESFDIKNGTKNLMEMRERVGKLRHQRELTFNDYRIGCILLEQPFFFDEKDWLPAPPDWKPSIVQGKKYDLTNGYGLSLWNQLHVSNLLSSVGKNPDSTLSVKEEQARYGSPIATFPRLGQGSFRVLVTDIYERRCAITHEKTLPALEAAHIKPYSESGQHVVSNGILLRRDLHALFDQGYVTITPSMKFEVSRKIKEEFENGKDYYRLQENPLWLPNNPVDRPSLEYIKWHNDNKYLG